MPTNFCIDYSNAEITPVSDNISCFDEFIFLSKLTEFLNPKAQKL